MRKDKVIRLWIYFRRGHNTYMAFLIGVANFVVIQYSFLVERVPFLKQVFPDILAFSVAFILVYLPTTVIIGWLDIRRGSLPAEGALAGEINPWVRDLLKALYLITDGREEEAREVLEKWVKRR